MHIFKLQAQRIILLSVDLNLELRMLEKLLEGTSGTTSASAWDGLVSYPLVQILMFGLDCQQDQQGRYI